MFTHGRCKIRSLSGLPLAVRQNLWGVPLRVSATFVFLFVLFGAFLDKIGAAYDRSPGLENLLFDKHFTDTITEVQADLRTIVATAATAGISVPCLSSALAYYDGLRTGRLPANLLQAQRDYFGAHTYERLDKPAGEYFHTNWTGTGGDTVSTTYNV